MTMAEKKMVSIQKQIEKLTKSLNRYQDILDKKIAKCEKLGCNWLDDEWFEHRDNCTPEQHQAHLEMVVAKSNVDDTEHRIQTLNNNLNKAAGKFEAESKKSIEAQMEMDRANQIESKWLAAAKKTAEEREAEYQAWLKQFKAECLKDGVVIENADNDHIYGTTKSGKRFAMYINNGMTERSCHCYTLRIEGNTIFTSGEFHTGYAIIKK
jgi:hypothetical protein